MDAERAFLDELGGGCNLPCGALAGSLAAAARPDRTAPGIEVLTIEVLLASLDGRMVLRAHSTGSDPHATGREAAHRLLDELGGRSLLEDVA